MRRPSSPQSASVAPPRRRPLDPSAAPPPKSAPPARGAPNRPVRAGPPGPAARRAPNTARRHRVALALVLTFVMLAAYGGYVLYDRVIKSDASTTASGNSFVASSERAMAQGGAIVAAGLEFRSLRESYVLRDQMTVMIDGVRTERANVESVLATTSGPRADTASAALQTMNELTTAMTQWRDAIFNLRFGGIDNTQAAIEGAIARLQQHIDAWNAQAES
jgi:hypothetical protein